MHILSRKCTYIFSLLQLSLVLGSGRFLILILQIQITFMIIQPRYASLFIHVFLLRIVFRCSSLFLHLHPFHKPQPLPFLFFSFFLDQEFDCCHCKLTTKLHFSATGSLCLEECIPVRIMPSQKISLFF